MNENHKIYVALSDPLNSRRACAALSGAAFRVQEAMDSSQLEAEAELFGATLVLLDGTLAALPLITRLSERSEPRCRVLAVAPVHHDALVRDLLDAGAADVASLEAGPSLLRLRVERLIELEELRCARLANQEEDVEAGHEADMELLQSVSDAIGSSLEPSDSLYVLVRRLGSVITSHRCNIVVRGREEHEAWVVASHEDPDLRCHPLDLRRYPEVRRALQDGRTLLIEDVRNDPEMEQVHDLITLVELRSVLVLPLYVREVAVGVLSVTTRRQVRGFSRREMLLLRTAANLAAGVLATTDLLEQVRRSAADQRAPMEELDVVSLHTEDEIQPPLP